MQFKPQKQGVMKMLQDKQKVYKSKVTWLAVLAQVVLILGFVLSPADITIVKVVIGSVIEILTIFGIINNPTNKNGI